MLILGEILKAYGISQRRLAREVGMSKSALNDLIVHGAYLKQVAPIETRRAIRAALAGMGVFGADLDEMFFEVEPETAATEMETAPCGNTAPSGDALLLQEVEMLLRKQVLSEAARRHWNLFRDPFDEPREMAEVFLSKPIRQVREAMWQCAIGNTRFLAVIGESGAGKSTLREELEERLRTEAKPVVVVSPYVLAMEDTDKKGRTLRSDHIAEALLNACASGETPKRSPEARFRQVHEALIASSRVGMHHVLVIEEAHGLPVPTLKHLKRFLELKDGMRRLVSVLLLGQPELRDKLDERRAAVREVVQRCQIVTLPALDGDLAAYLTHRFSTVGATLDAVLEPAAVDALTQALTIAQRSGKGSGDVQRISLIHPLVANNLLTAAMNQAASLGAPKVTADLVRAVREAA